MKTSPDFDHLSLLVQSLNSNSVELNISVILILVKLQSPVLVTTIMNETFSPRFTVSFNVIF